MLFKNQGCDFYIRPYTNDKTKFLMCSNGFLFKRPCPKGTMFSARYKTCVSKRYPPKKWDKLRSVEH